MTSGIWLLSITSHCPRSLWGGSKFVRRVHKYECINKSQIRASNMNTSWLGTERKYNVMLMLLPHWKCEDQPLCKTRNPVMTFCVSSRPFDRSLNQCGAWFEELKESKQPMNLIYLQLIRIHFQWMVHFILVSIDSDTIPIQMWLYLYLWQWWPFKNMWWHSLN